MLSDTAMIVVNAVGFALQLCYTGIYYLYASAKVKIVYPLTQGVALNHTNASTFQAHFRRQVVIVLSIVLCTMLYVALEPNVETAKFRLGLICCATTLIFCSAPLASLVTRIFRSLKRALTKL